MSETFTFMTRSWDVDKALEMVNGREPSGTVSVEQLTGFFGLIRIDKEYAKTADLSRPVIMVPMQDAYMMIDGWHRAWRAHEGGIKELPAYVLTEKEEKRVRIH